MERIAIGITFVLCLVLLVGNFGNSGIFGKALSQVQFGLFGRLSYFAPFLLFFSVVFLFSNKRNPNAFKKVLAAWVLFLCLCAFYHLAAEGFDESTLLSDYYAVSADYRTGGGAAAGLMLTATTLAFGWIGGMIVLCSLALVCLIELTQKSFVDFVLAVTDYIHPEALPDDEEDSVRDLKKELRSRKKLNATRQRRRKQIAKLEQALEEEEEKGKSLSLDRLDPDDFEDEDDLRYKDLIGEEKSEDSLAGEPEIIREDRERTSQDEITGEKEEFIVNEHGIRRKTDEDEESDLEEESEDPDQDRSYRPAGKKPKKTKGARKRSRMKETDEEEPGMLASLAKAARRALSIELEDEDEGLDFMYSDSAQDKKDDETEESSFEDMPKTRLAIHRMYTEMMEEDPGDTPGFVVQDAADPQKRGKDPAEKVTPKEASVSREKETDREEEAVGEETAVSMSGLNQKRDQQPAWIGAESVKLVTMPDFGNSDFGKYLSGHKRAGTRFSSESLDLPDDEDFGFFDHRDEGSGEDNRPDQSVEEELPDQPEEENLPAENEPDPSVPDQLSAEKETTEDTSPFEGGDDAGIPAGEDSEAKESAAASGAGERSIESYMEGKVPRPPKPYVFPTLDLLTKGSTKYKGLSDETLKETADKLQNILYNFGVNVTVTDVSCGPTVTRYELQPELGVKVSRIVSLADDIKLNLAAEDIRIEAPIPGKAAVGIEVPNKERIPVSLRELIASSQFRESRSKLSFAVGKDIAGTPVVTDIAQMPHLLIAGATGAGKSVCINTLIISILYKAKPTEVQMIMIDPKVVELSIYNGIPHLLIDVVTDPKKASGALNWAVDEMTRRYKLFSEYNVRNIGEFNHKLDKMDYDSEKPEKMTQIVIIVDELADLMMVAPGEVEDAICRLAQLARAAGIHLVIATQRPSVNVITGLIKANMPSRIAFAVSSGIDSRTILDSYGAEKLLGKGDMLFAPQGMPKPSRLQGAFVSDEEISKVVNFLKDSNQAFISQDTRVEKQVSDSIMAKTLSGKDDRDALFTSAGKFIIEKDRASIGQLQRVFKIGFNRAARIMDQLCAEGVVGPEEGTKPRKILMTMEDFEKKYERSIDPKP